MFGRHRHRPGTADVEPDLPITPMLDMSFQLLAFFIMTFQPTKTEGQIMVALPKAEGSNNLNTSDILNPDKPMDFTAQVKGGGGAMTQIRVFRGPKEGEQGKEHDVTTFDIKEGSERQSVKGYMDDVIARLKSAPNQKARLTLEIDESLPQAYVVLVFDAGVRAFQLAYGPNANAEISPVPLDASKR